jgi:DNA-binding response OmpR family regulator
MRNGISLPRFGCFGKGYSMHCLLVIDDDTEFCNMLAEYLAPEGFEVTPASSGVEGLERAFSAEYDLIILDINLPGMSGFEVLRRIRSRLDTPILVLSSRTEEVDRVVGLELGADDFLPKPFSYREFLARARAILRRTKGHPARKTSLFTNGKIVIGDIELDTDTRVVRCKGRRLELTSVEFNFLEMLLKAAGRVVTREQLAEQALGRPLMAYDRSVDVHLSNLRKKLGHKFAGNERIKTVRGTGYIYARTQRDNPWRIDEMPAG